MCLFAQRIGTFLAQKSESNCRYLICLAKEIFFVSVCLIILKNILLTASGVKIFIMYSMEQRKLLGLLI